MVQFLSIFFGGDFFNFCWGFQKFPFFLCHSVSDKRVVRADEDPEDKKKRKLTFSLEKVELLDNVDS